MIAFLLTPKHKQKRNGELQGKVESFLSFLHSISNAHKS